MTRLQTIALASLAVAVLGMKVFVFWPSGTDTVPDPAAGSSPFALSTASGVIDCHERDDVTDDCLSPLASYPEIEEERRAVLVAQAMTGVFKVLAPQDWPPVSADLLRAAHLGDREAQFLLGRAMRASYGIEGAESQGLAWIVRAAEQGLEAASVELVNLFLMESDLPAAGRWLERLAQAGDPVARLQLATLLGAPDSAISDPVRAVDLLSSLVHEGVVEASAYLVIVLAAEGPAQDVERARSVFEAIAPADLATLPEGLREALLVVVGGL